MTQIQMILSMNKSIINKITEFKNKEIKKDELNKYLLVSLSRTLKSIEKIKESNKEIQRQQDIEIKKSLSTIKSYHGKIDYSSKDLESKPIMKRLINPTLESYIPVSEISYSTEIQFYKKDFDKCNFNESLLFEATKKKDLDNEEKEIEFEESPIIFIKHDNNLKKLKNENINSIKGNYDIADLIEKDDDEIFIKEDKDDQFKNLFYFDLMNSFDEDNKEDIEINKEDIELDFKKMEYSFYLDDIFSNQRSSKRNSLHVFNTLSNASNSTSFGSRGNSKSDSKSSINKDLYDSEFTNYMSFESFNKWCQQMSIDYLRYMLVVYSNILNNSKKFTFCEEQKFINLIKSFILKIGISSKKVYEKIIDNVLRDKDDIINFEKFIKSFSHILKLKDENSVLKYKFIMSLFRFAEEDINVKHLNIYFQLIKGKMIYDSELFDELNNNLIQRYDRVYSTEIGANFKFRNILLILETFFYKKVGN